MSETQDAALRVAVPPPVTAHLAGKYMAFQLAGEVHALEIRKVRELIGRMDITRVPRAREFVRGVINLRGKVIPVPRRPPDCLIAEGAEQLHAEDA